MTDDWRGEMLGRLRKILREADRALGLREGGDVDEAALKSLIRGAVALDAAKAG